MVVFLFHMICDAGKNISRLFRNNEIYLYCALCVCGFSLFLYFIVFFIMTYSTGDSFHSFGELCFRVRQKVRVFTLQSKQDDGSWQAFPSKSVAMPYPWYVAGTSVADGSTNRCCEMAQSRENAVTVWSWQGQVPRTAGSSFRESER